MINCLGKNLVGICKTLTEATKKHRKPLHNQQAKSPFNRPIHQIKTIYMVEGHFITEKKQGN